MWNKSHIGQIGSKISKRYKRIHIFHEGSTWKFKLRTTYVEQNHEYGNRGANENIEHQPKRNQDELVGKSKHNPNTRSSMN